MKSLNVDIALKSKIDKEEMKKKTQKREALLQLALLAVEKEFYVHVYSFEHWILLINKNLIINQ